MLFVDIVVKSALSAGFLKLAKRYPDSITTAGLLRKLSASCWQLVSSGCRRQPAYLPHVWGTYNYDVWYRASDHARPEDATSLIMCIKFPLLRIATICIIISINK